MGVTRFPHGITNVRGDDVLRDLGMIDPTKYVSYFNDFITGQDYDDTNAWILTQTGGTVAVVASATNGLLTLTTGATLNNHAFLQLRGFPILPTAGKKLFFKTRLKVDVLTSASIIAGFQNVDTSPLSYTDGMIFLRETTDTTWTAMCRKDGSTGATQQTGLSSLSADTFVVLGMYYNGKDSVEYYVNNIKRATLNGSSTYLPDTNLSISFGIQTTETVAKVLTVDYVFMAMER